MADEPTRGRGDLPQAIAHVLLLDRGPTPAFTGWMLDPDHGPFDRLEALVDGSSAGVAELRVLPRLRRTMPWVKRAERGGFLLQLDPGSEHARRLELVGHRDGVPAGRHRMLLRSSSEKAIPLPPETIAEPSTGRTPVMDEAERRAWERGWLSRGMAAAANLLDQVEMHRGGSQGLRLLDWGCGCGRVTRHFLDKGFSSVSGCDPDGQAISWCEKNLPGADFAQSALEPPLELEDASVDVSVGCSVMTHLDAARQARWLAELRRVTAPGGLVLLSTQGEFQYRRRHVQRLRVLGRWGWLGRAVDRRATAKLDRDGFVDRGATEELAGIAPHGYYRSVAQSADYTRREWSAHFEIVDQIERGLEGYQDLVVMRRRAA